MGRNKRRQYGKIGRGMMVGLLLACACIFLMQEPAQAASPQISSKKISLVVGNSKTLKLKNNKKKVVWKSSKSSVAKVSSKGVVTAQKRGTATVTAKVGKKKYTCKVTVKDAKLNRSSLSLTEKKSYQLKFTNSKGKVKWSSANKSVATVSSKGAVKAVKAGKTTIKAKVASSTYQCQVTVKKAPPADATATTLEFYTAGGGDFTCGPSKAEVKFALDTSTTKVEAQILDAADQVVYKKSFATCRKGQSYTFQWDGRKADGSYVGDNSCRVRIKAGKKETLSANYLTVSEKNDFAGGNGSQKNPYQVADLAQLQKVSQHNGCYFVQTDNIDGNYADFIAMFREDNPFVGTYDGAGKTISNLLIKNTSDGDGSAMFYIVGEKGLLKNITLSNCSANLGTKLKRGYGACLVAKNSGSIQGCVFDNCTTLTNVEGNGKYGYSGIICAEQQETGSITGCKVLGGNLNVTLSGWDGNRNAGGIVANNYGKVINCSVENLKGESISGFGRIGGIVAVNQGSGKLINVKVSATELNCSGTQGNSYAGGIAAENKGQISGWSWGNDGTLTGNKTGDCCPDAGNSGIITQ